MKRRFELPTSYDGIVNPGKMFTTETGRFLCSDHVQGNRALCSDQFWPEWFIIGEIKCPVDCSECQEARNEQ